MWRSITQEWARKAENHKNKMTLETILEEYKHHWKVFSEEESKSFPPAREEDMSIKLKEGAPPVINCKVYSLSQEECVQLQKFLATEMELAQIKEKPSPYTSPVYFINKKDSTEKCIIMDYRKLNKWTVHDNNLLPNIWEALENLQGKNLFLKFDICLGYNNIWIKEEDQYKAAFKTNYGTYILQVMYFGLMNALSFFQRVMHWDFRPLLQKYPENLKNYYMNDWWVTTADTKKGCWLHKQIIHEFLDLMEEKSYFLKASKMQFERPQMEILGWQVGGGCIRIDPSKVAGIAEWPRKLKNVKEVRSTLGVLGYQQPFIKNFATIAWPLHNLTKKNVPFEWTQECTDALEQLIQVVILDPVLYQPNFSKQFKLEVDASLFGVGMMLFQRNAQNRWRPVSYYSVALNAAKRNYNIWDREFLGMIKGLKHNWHLLVGSLHKAVILMDHENLGHYWHPQKINRWVTRYLHYMADFDLELRHIPRANNKADALSHQPDHDDGSWDNEKIVALPDSLFAWAIEMGTLDKKIWDQQQVDKDIWTKWKRVQKCTEEEGALFKDGALVVTAGEQLYKDILL